jgi:hypothetical protein
VADNHGIDRALVDFDVHALYRALDGQRAGRGLSWNGVAREMWELSAELNARRNDHPIAGSTLVNMNRRGASTCQHVLFMLRWLGKAPEDFVPGVVVSRKHALPRVGADRRLRWSLLEVYAALDTERGRRGLTWRTVAAELGCGPSQLTSMRKLRYAIEMKLAMRIVAWVGRPAADFVYAAEW